MSIATLKRKTQAKYNNVSVGQRQFSLNGTHRSQGYVGQTMLSRHFPSSLMKGNVIRGHGGCCGTYPINPMVQSGINYQEDSRVVKSSVMNTAGMIETKYCVGNCVKGVNTCHECIKRMDHVKPDSNNNNNTQEYYINKVAKNAVLDTANCNIIKKDVPQYQIHNNNLGSLVVKVCTITKSDQECKIPMSSGEHTKYLKNGCTILDAKPLNPSMGKIFGC